MSELPERTRQAVMAVQQEWVAQELAGDVAGVLALCADDVVWLPPDGPALRGKGAVAAWLAAQPKSRVLRVEVTNVRIDGSGGLACKVADFTTWQETGGKASDEPVKGSHLWVLREASPGQWRLAAVAWSIAAPKR